MKKLKFYHWLIISFVGMIIVGLSVGYAIDRSKNKGIQGTKTQVTSPKVESPKIEEKKNEPKAEESVNKETKSEAKTPAQEETAAEPQITSPSNTKPVCDEARKAPLFVRYNEDLIQAEAERRKLYDEAIANYNAEIALVDQRCSAIWDPFARENCRKGVFDAAGRTLEDAKELANMDYNGTKTYLDAMYNLDLKSINCSN